MAGGVIGIFLTKKVLSDRLLAKSKQILVDAEAKAEVIKKDKILQAKEKYLQMKSEYDKQVSERRARRCV